MDGSVIIIPGGYMSVWNGGPNDSPLLVVDKHFFALSGSPHFEGCFEPPNNALQATRGVATGEVVRGTSTPTGSLPCSGSSSHPLFPHQKNQDLGSTCFQTLTSHQDISSSLRRAPPPSLPSAMSARKSVDGGLPYLSSEWAQSYHNSQPSSSTLTLDDPPPFLLDDDPFANLSVVSPPHCFDRKPARSSRSSTLVQPIMIATTTTLIAPRSPLSPPNSAASSYFGAVQTTPPRARSLGKFKPAYERPAFSSPPSLPSLDTLARMSIPPPRKVRRGKVGAQLPFEPWERTESEEERTLETPCITRPASPSSMLAQIQTQYITGRSAEGIADVGFRDSMGFDSPGGLHPSFDAIPSRYNSDRESFSFFDNLSTPSLEHSSASISRCLSCESVLPPGISPGDELDQFGKYLLGQNVNKHSGHHPSEPNPPFHIDSTPNPLDNLPDNDSPLQYQIGLSIETTLPSASGQDSMPLKTPTDATGSSSSQDYSGNPQFGYGYNGYGDQDGGQNDYQPRSDGGGWSGGRGGSGRGNDGGDRRRGRPTHGPALSGSSTTDTSSDEEDDSEDDYGQPISYTTKRRVTDSGPGTTSSEDDVPLARRIPTALQAQRTIRKQYKEERDRRRQERALKAGQGKEKWSSPPPHMTELPHQMTTIPSKQESAPQTAQQLPQTRPRTRTMPSNTPRPFAPEELARKLQDIQVAETSRAQPRRPATSGGRGYEELNRGRTRTTDDPLLPPYSQHDQQTNHNLSRTAATAETNSRPLRAMKSFHHSERRSDDAQNPTSPADAGHNISRRATTSRARSRVREETAPPSAWQPPPLPTQVLPKSPTSNVPALPPLPQPRHSGEPPRKLSKIQTTSAKTSVDLSHKPPMSAMSALSASPASANIKTQQRIFIGDMQRFNVVEIDNSTSAEDVVNVIRNQGSLNGMYGHGGWMLFEVAQDFGMERPIRYYELLSDVQASWNKDKLVNMFVLKMTPLAVPLSRDAIPSSSPTHGGYVEWEVKRGKWNKRWLRLREHNLWLAKRDNGKDEVLLCSLSNFDAYFVTRACKAPQPFVFAVKSTDNLSFFENTADYMHTFSCQPRDGQKWIEKIMIARSYVLYQERNVLFNPKTTGGNATGNTASISHAITRKTRPTQPLVSVPPAYPGTSQPHSAHSTMFEPGSLLAKN